MSSYIRDMWSLASQGELQGIWFFAAAYALLLCGYSVLYQLKVRGWPRTLGYLQAAGSVESGSTQPVRSEQEYQAQARYDYRVSDQDYEGQRVSPWVFLASHNLRFLLKQQVNAIEPSQAGRVQVLYNPRRPGMSFLLPPSKLGIALTCLIAIGPSVGFLLKF